MLLRILTFTVLFLALDGAQLKDVRRVKRSDEPSLQPGGQNVCVFKNTKTVTKIHLVERQQLDTDDTVCCRKYIFCWKKCKRLKTSVKKVTVIRSELQNYDSYRCCQGWTVKTSDARHCLKPLCAPYCRNNGICVNADQACNCNGTNFEGRYCQNDINECETGKNSCDQKCINTPGSYICGCNEGFIISDKDSTSCTATNPCLLHPCSCFNNDTRCDSMDICINPPNSGQFHCTCPSTMRLVNNQCIDRNQCEEKPDICHQVCVNLNGKPGYVCECFPGYKYDEAKKKCLPQNVCKYTNAGCDHVCISNNHGGSYCLCDKGYTLQSDGMTCKDQNECTSPFPPCDTTTSNCINLPGTYRCGCHNAYLMFNQVCTDRDECKEKTDGCEQICDNKIGGYKCSCKPGYLLKSDGHLCEDIDECKSKLLNYCEQKCINQPGNYSCACNDGYNLQAEGYNCMPRPCEKVTDPYYGEVRCNGFYVGRKCSFTCLDGFSLVGPAERECMPTGQWSGTEVKCKAKSCGPVTSSGMVNNKFVLPCEETLNATCPVTCLDKYILRGSGLIQCKFSMGGMQWSLGDTKCEKILVCDPNPCKNGGKCNIITDTEYSCDCTAAYTGMDCDLLKIVVPSIPVLDVASVSPSMEISADPQFSSIKITLSSEFNVTTEPVEMILSPATKKQTFQVASTTTGLKWLKFDILSSHTSVQPVNDRLLYFYDKALIGSTQFSTLLTMADPCFTLLMQTDKSLNPVKFYSSSFWQQTVNGLVTTNGVLFVNALNTVFPLILSKINIQQYMYEIQNRKTLSIQQGSSCQGVPLTEDQLQAAIMGDVFINDFFKQFNKLTPDWFTLTPHKMSHFGVDNIRAQIWNSEQINSHETCKGAAIDEQNIFLVYVHIGGLNVKAHENEVVMSGSSHFCLIVDLITSEPHIVMPPEHRDSLNELFSFLLLQSMGWDIYLVSVGFRMSSETDPRKCKDIGARQMVFGSAIFNFTSKGKDETKGVLEGQLFYALKNDGQKEVMDQSSRCFDGESHIRVITWSFDDIVRRKYTKKLPANRAVGVHTTAVDKTTSLLNIVQGQDAVLKVSGGYRPMLFNSGPSVSFNFTYKEAEQESGGGGTAGADSFTYYNALMNALTPIKDVKLSADSTSLLGGFSVSAWYSEISLDSWDMVDPMGKLKTHYLKAVQYMPTFQKIPEYQGKLTELEAVIKSLKVLFGGGTKKNEFQYLALNFNARVCFLEPCLEQINLDIYPATIDKGFTLKCYENKRVSQYAIWQARGSQSIAQSRGQFFTFDASDHIEFCLTDKGIERTLITGTVNILGTPVKGSWEVTASPRSFKTGKKNIKLFNEKFTFYLDSTVDMEYDRWDMMHVHSYGLAESSLTTKIQDALQSYSNAKYSEANSRVESTNKLILQYQGLVSAYKKNLNLSNANLQNITQHVNALKAERVLLYDNFLKFNTSYAEKRDEMLEISALFNNCTLDPCDNVCDKQPNCTLYAKPYNVDVPVPSCDVSVDTVTYKFLRSENDRCSHLVQDEGTDYTGSCDEDKPANAKAIVDSINEKIKKKLPLQITDADLLESVYPDKGQKLREYIEQQMFLDNFPTMLNEGLLTDSDFKKLEDYTNQTFANKYRKKMKEIMDAKVLQDIEEKLKDDTLLNAEDYRKVGEVDQSLVDKLKKAEAIATVGKKIQMMGKITEADLAELKKIDPEYAAEVAGKLDQQKKIEEAFSVIQRKLANGTLTDADIDELAKYSPESAEKLREALKKELTERVKEVQKKLTNMDSVMEAAGFGNDSSLGSLRKQLDVLTDNSVNFTDAAVADLQKKIEAINSSAGDVFHNVLERFQLSITILNLTGNSEDVGRVLTELFKVLPQFHVDSILQRSTVGTLEGLVHIQSWFNASAASIEMLCNCGSQCDTYTNIQYTGKILKPNLNLFLTKVCDSEWGKKVKNDAVKSICKTIADIEQFLTAFASSKTDNCSAVHAHVVQPFRDIVAKWKEARIAATELNSNEWKTTERVATLMKKYSNLSATMTSAYSAFIGSFPVKFYNESEIFEQVAKTLDANNSAVTYSTTQVWENVLNSTRIAVADLPSLITKVKGSGELKIDISKEEIDVMNSLYASISEGETILNEMCADKNLTSQQAGLLSRLTMIVGMKFKSVLEAKDMETLVYTSKGYDTIAQQALAQVIIIKKSLLPCTFPHEATNSTEDTATDGLRLFLSATKPIEYSTVQSQAAKVTGILSNVTTLSTPIGKLNTLLKAYAGAKPAYHLSTAFFVDPKTSYVIFNSVSKYFESIIDIFNYMIHFLSKCDGCSPQDIFGTSTLTQVCGDIDAFLKPFSLSAREFDSVLHFSPDSFDILITSFDQVRTSLQTISRTKTGFNVEGLKVIVGALQDTDGHVDDCRNNIMVSYNKLSGVSNNDIKYLKEVLEDFADHSGDFFKFTKGKEEQLLALHEKVQAYHDSLGDMKLEEVTVGAMHKRNAILEKAMLTIKDQFETLKDLYESEDSSVLQYVDNNYIPAIESLVRGLMANFIPKFFNHTILMTQKGYIYKNVTVKYLPVFDFEPIARLVKATASQKLPIIDEILKEVNEDVKILGDGINSLDEYLSSTFGGLSIYKNETERLAHALQGLSRLDNEFDFSWLQIKKVGVSNIGELKDITTRLVDSFDTISLSKMYLANTDIFSRKADECKVLYFNTETALENMVALVKSCKDCKDHRIFGKTYVSLIMKKLTNFFSSSLKDIGAILTLTNQKNHDSKPLVKILKEVTLSLENNYKEGKFDISSFTVAADALARMRINIDELKSINFMSNLVFTTDINVQVLSSKLSALTRQFDYLVNATGSVGQNVQTVRQSVSDLRLEMNKGFEINSKYGPVDSRFDFVKALTNKEYTVISSLKTLFTNSPAEMTNNSLTKAWMQTFAYNILTYVNSKVKIAQGSSDIVKTSKIDLNATTGLMLANFDGIKNTLNEYVKLPETPYANISGLMSNITDLFHYVDDVTLKQEKALEANFNAEDLVSAVETTISKEREKSYKEQNGLLITKVNNLKGKEIASIGSLTDSLVGIMDHFFNYNLRKMTLLNSNAFKGTAVELSQVISLAGYAFHNISTVCGSCNIEEVFGIDFLHYITDTMPKKFAELEKALPDAFNGIIKNPDASLLKIIDGVKEASAIFNSAISSTAGLKTAAFFSKYSTGLLNSAEKINETLFGQQDSIYQNVFHGDDIEPMLAYYNNLTAMVQNVIVDTNVPSTGFVQVVEALTQSKAIIAEVKNDTHSILDGPLEKRMHLTNIVNKGFASMRTVINSLISEGETKKFNADWLSTVNVNSQKLAHYLDNTVDISNAFLAGKDVVEEIFKTANKTLGSFSQESTFLKETLNRAGVDLALLKTKADSLVELARVTSGVIININDSLATCSNFPSGLVQAMSSSAKFISSIDESLLTEFKFISDIAGPIEKVGEVIDATTSFISLMKDYKLSEIVVLPPKDVVERLKDIRDIVSNTGIIFGKISGLVCPKCNIGDILGIDQEDFKPKQMYDNVMGIAGNVNTILKTVEDSSVTVTESISLIGDIVSNSKNLQYFEFSKEGFLNVSNTLQKTVSQFSDLYSKGDTLAKAFYTGSAELKELKSHATGVVDLLKGFLVSTGNKDAADKAEKFLENTDSPVLEGSQGSLANRMSDASNLADGVNTAVAGVPDLMKNKNITMSTMQLLTGKFKNFTSSLAKLVNTTKFLAGEIGAGIKDVTSIIDTSKKIGSDFESLFSSGGSFEGKLDSTISIVKNLQSLTGDVNSVTKHASNVIEVFTGKTLIKTNLIGNTTQKYLSKIGTALETVADRYDKFKALSQGISDSFNNIESDPIKFALYDLPKLLGQGTEFIGLIIGDVKSIAKNLGYDLSKVTADMKLAAYSKKFFNFANSALGTFTSGAALVFDFKALIDSSNFKDAMFNFQKVLSSGTTFIKNVDALGDSLFKNWDSTKSEFSAVFDKIGQKLGLELKSMGGMLKKGFAVGGSILSIASNIEQLLKIDKFDLKAVLVVADTVVNVASSALEIAQAFGFLASEAAVELAGTVLGVAGAGIQILKGIVDFVSWVNSACDITYTVTHKSKTIHYVCFKPAVREHRDYFYVVNCKMVPKQYQKGFFKPEKRCIGDVCVYKPAEACLQAREDCINHRKDVLLQKQQVDKVLMAIFTNHWQSRYAVSAIDRRISSQVRQLKLKEIDKEKAESSLSVASEILRKAEATLTPLKAKKLVLGKLLSGSTSTLTVINAEISLIYYQPDVTVLPLKINYQDAVKNNYHVTVSVDFKDEQQSLMEMSREIASNYLGESITRRRKRRAISTDDLLLKKRIHWATVCVEFQSSFSLINILFRDLEASLQHGTIATAIDEWKDNSAKLLGNADIDLYCAGYVDCYAVFFEDISSKFDAAMGGYDMAITNVKKLEVVVGQLKASMSQQSAVALLEEAMKSLHRLNVSAQFCDRDPSLPTQMDSFRPAYEGDVFTMKCTMDGPPTMVVTWQRNGLLLPAQLATTLRIYGIQKTDAGNYTCTGTTGNNVLVSNKVNVVVMKPLMVTIQPENHNMLSQVEDVQFVCNGTGEPSVDIEWWFKPYSASEPHSVGNAGLLEIKQASAVNVGQYWCSISNSFDVVNSRRAQLDILQTKELTKTNRMDLKIFAKEGACPLPIANETANFESFFAKQLTESVDTNDLVVKVSYKYIDDENQPKLSFEVTHDPNKNGARLSTSVTSAEVSRQKHQIYNVVSNIANYLERGLVVKYRSTCDYIVFVRTQATIESEIMERACPIGMGKSSDNLRCVQCAPGSFDNGKGMCAPCPVGTYQSSPGQTKCEACGTGRLSVTKATPDIHECQKIDYVCGNEMHAIIILDLSVSAIHLDHLKSFVNKFASHMVIAEDEVELSVITMGNTTKLEIFSGRYNNIGEFQQLVSNLQPQVGSYQFEQSLNLVSGMIDLEVESKRHVVVYVTASEEDVVIPSIEDKAEKLRLDGVEIFAFVANDHEATLKGFLDIISVPAGMHMFKIKDPTYIQSWSTAAAAAVCRNLG